jgi:hypothetical protein
VSNKSVGSRNVRRGDTSRRRLTPCNFSRNKNLLTVSLDMRGMAESFKVACFYKNRASLYTQILTEGVESISY